MTLDTVCLSRHHNIGRHKSRSTPTHFQFAPLSCLRRWRLVLAIPLWYSVAPYLVYEAPPWSLTHTNVLYSALPGMQHLA
jgi:hypothetical protein